MTSPVWSPALAAAAPLTTPLTCAPGVVAKPPSALVPAPAYDGTLATSTPRNAAGPIRTVLVS